MNYFSMHAPTDIAQNESDSNKRSWLSIWNKLPVNLSSIPRIKPVLSAIAFYQIKFDLICFILLF